MLPIGGTCFRRHLTAIRRQRTSDRSWLERRSGPCLRSVKHVHRWSERFVCLADGSIRTADNRLVTSLQVATLFICVRSRSASCESTWNVSNLLLRTSPDEDNTRNLNRRTVSDTSRQLTAKLKPLVISWLFGKGSPWHTQLDISLGGCGIIAVSNTQLSIPPVPVAGWTVWRPHSFRQVPIPDSDGHLMPTRL